MSRARSLKGIPLAFVSSIIIILAMGAARGVVDRLEEMDGAWMPTGAENQVLLRTIARGGYQAHRLRNDIIRMHNHDRPLRHKTCHALRARRIYPIARRGDTNRRTGLAVELRQKACDRRTEAEWGGSTAVWTH